MLPTEFYLVPEELFRIGNQTGPRLNHIRPRDVHIVKIDNVDVVIANGRGISVFDKIGLNESPMTGWVWCIPKITRLPYGLKLVNDKAHHYCVAPAHNMSVAQYRELLDKFASRASRVFHKQGKAV